MKNAENFFESLYDENKAFNERVPANIKNDIKNIYKQYGKNADDKTVNDIYIAIKETVKEKFVNGNTQSAEKIIDIAASEAKKEIEKRLNR